MTHRKAALVILDGLGVNDDSPRQDAVRAAIEAGKAPTFAKLFAGPMGRLGASGRAVGLSDGQIGNSEVGHLTIGAGRISRQWEAKGDDFFADGSFAAHPAWNAALDRVRACGGAVHALGLFGPGGVHAAHGHLEKFVAAVPSDVRVWLHLFSDGRDVGPTSFLDYWTPFAAFLEKFPHVRVATVGGRYWGMDRDNNWDRVKTAWNAIVEATSPTTLSVEDYARDQYAQGKTDEFFEPASFGRHRGVRSGDAVVFLNFRSDRAKQLTRALCDADFQGFGRRALLSQEDTYSQGPYRPGDLSFLSMSRYYAGCSGAHFLDDEKLDDVLGAWLAKLGKTQFHTAETEKYAHVTKFLNGGTDAKFPGETDALVASHKVATFDLDPAMAAREVWEQFQANAAAFDFTVVNYANGDMVGHTGNFAACVEAVAALDAVLADTIEYCAQNSIELLVTADHGNCEEMGTSDAPKTNHSLNPVPFWHIRGGAALPVAATGGLADIAPSVLAAMGLEAPKEMTGRSLLGA